MLRVKVEPDDADVAGTGMPRGSSVISHTHPDVRDVGRVRLTDEKDTSRCLAWSLQALFFARYQPKLSQLFLEPDIAYGGTYLFLKCPDLDESRLPENMLYRDVFSYVKRLGQPIDDIGRSELSERLADAFNSFDYWILLTGGRHSLALFRFQGRLHVFNPHGNVDTVCATIASFDSTDALSSYVDWLCSFDRVRKWKLLAVSFERGKLHRTRVPVRGFQFNVTNDDAVDEGVLVTEYPGSHRMEVSDVAAHDLDLGRRAVQALIALVYSHVFEDRRPVTDVVVFAELVHQQLLSYRERDDISPVTLPGSVDLDGNVVSIDLTPTHFEGRSVKILKSYLEFVFGRDDDYRHVILQFVAVDACMALYKFAGTYACFHSLPAYTVDGESIKGAGKCVRAQFPSTLEMYAYLMWYCDRIGMVDTAFVMYLFAFRTAEVRAGNVPKKRPSTRKPSKDAVGKSRTKRQPAAAKKGKKKPAATIDDANMQPPTSNIHTPIDDDCQRDKPSRRNSELADDDKLKKLIRSVSEQVESKYGEQLKHIQAISDTISKTASQVSQNKDAISNVTAQAASMREQRRDLQKAVDGVKEIAAQHEKLSRLKEGSEQKKKRDSDDLERAKIQAQIQAAQAEHDIKLNQIQSSIAIAEIKAKSQSYAVNTQYELGLGKLRLEEWKTELQNVLSKESLFKNHEHQFNMIKVQSELENDKQKQKDWYTAMENERDRKFKKELQENKHEQTARLDYLEKQFRQFQTEQKREHDSSLKERDERFATDMQKLKDEHAVFIEANKREFTRLMEHDRQSYEINMTEIKHDFSDGLQRNKAKADREMLDHKQLFTLEMEDRKLASSSLHASRKEHTERYKTDLMASVKNRQIDKQDENEKLKLEMKMAEYNLKIEGAIAKASTNKFQFRIHPQPITAFEFQMEKSADVAPHSAIRAFEQLWNTQYELDMDPKRVLKYKKELTTMAKKTVENHAVFAAT